MKAATDVLDSLGKPISAGSIVGMSDPDGSWSRFQGFVVAPFSEIEGDGYTVAVFFGTEVDRSHFASRFSKVSEWDTLHGEKLRGGDWTFLLDGNVWKNCPRIIFFRPDELVVQEVWNIEAMVRRLYSNRWHTSYGFPKGVGRKPSDYLCFMEGCSLVATQTALFNVWGSVYPMHVCDTCFAEVNGRCGDQMPGLHSQFRLASGEPVPSAS